MDALNASITNFINLATAIAIVACGFYLCVAGFYWMSAQGNPSNIERAKGAASNAVVGLAVVLSARVIANIIQGAVVR